VPPPALDEQAALALVARVVSGDRAAWQSLVEILFPMIEHIARSSHSMGPLRASIDHCRNVATDTLDKLERNDYRALSILDHWRTANPTKTFLDWLRIVTTNVARDYVEKQLGSGRAPGMDERAKKRALHTLATALPPDDQGQGLRPPVTDQQTTREILEYAREHLAADQLAALSAWLERAELVEIGAIAGSSDRDPKELARHGEKLVRAALARLRRQFAVDTGAG
jgi:hypothetical protein